MNPDPHAHLLGAYVLGVLAAPERTDLEAHLAVCPACGAELVELEAVKGMLDEVPPEALLNGPPGADLVLQRTLRQMRAERGPAGWRRRTLAVAVAAVLLAGGIVTGVLVGRSTAPAAPVATGSAPPSPSATLPSGVRAGSTVDPTTHVRLTAQIIPAAGWIRIHATITGLPVGANCRLVVLGRDGQREVAGGWIVTARGSREGTPLDGSAAIAPADVTGVAVVDTAGRTYATLWL